ncbi:MAG: glutamine synthetase family protein [Lentimicrobiaceae bacterium]|nr:glutamine synthetase family protein [Lentimicrobiaceae bacterium]
MNRLHDLHPNPLVQYLNKPSESFTRADLIKFIEDHSIEMINFRYTGGDGRLKTLNFVISSREHLESILTTGERVDGSSLFPFIQAGSSDLYVVPRYRTAFLNPFSEIPAIDILCSYYNKDGAPLESSPEYILRKAHAAIKEKTGYDFHVMGELEFYIISNELPLFEGADQKGYHESYPFAKWESLRTEAMTAMAKAGCLIKYGHSEVGNFTLDHKLYEQNEIEFMPTHPEAAADQLMIAKWVLRVLAQKYGVTVTFAPKITLGKAGSGLHVHTKLLKDGKNVMLKDGKISDAARHIIAGYLGLAPSLTAFGNTNPTSYFRLVPHQEAPTNICWGDRNRSVLVRVPLGWASKHNMIYDANPQEPHAKVDFSQLQTVEFRCSDGSADIYLLMAGLTVAARHGLEMSDALRIAAETYVDVNIFDEKNKERLAELNQLPLSCWESATMLEQQAHIYMKYNVFPKELIDGTIRRLRSYKDEHLREQIKDSKEKIMHVVNQYFHCG